MMRIFDRVSDILFWLEKKNDLSLFHVEKIKFSQLKDWNFQTKTGNLAHQSGNFFKLIGADIITNWGEINRWSQPIILQDEIGILGILLKYINDVPHFLLQAKFEPGNINGAQLSPTTQATKSNYSKVHGGSSVKYLSYFKDFSKKRVVIDQLQSEQGSRFLKKRNRNIIIEIKEDIDLDENFLWVSISQIIELLEKDNIINMNTRSVLAGFLLHNFKDIKKQFTSVHSYNEIISWITEQKVNYELNVKEIPLHSVNNWEITEEQIKHKHDKYFSVIPLNVNIKGREVENWTQPILESKQDGICAFIVKKILGTWHFLIQAKVECGNVDIIEMAPTVQCLNDNFKRSVKILPFLDYVLNVNKKDILFDTMFSEEGGRFYHEQNRNMIVKVSDKFPIHVPDNYIWLTLHQLNHFLKFNNYLNVQSRSLLSTIVGKEHEYC